MGGCGFSGCQCWLTWRAGSLDAEPLPFDLLELVGQRAGTAVGQQLAVHRGQTAIFQLKLAVIIHWKPCCSSAGVYGDGEFRADRAYPYVALVNNCAQMAALYCLVLMYNATHAELVPIRPLSKFIVIKVRGQGRQRGLFFL